MGDAIRPPSRGELDALAEHHRLDRAGVEALLEVSGARPSPAEDLALARRTLGLAGVLSLCAGVVFLVAANWEAIGAAGRFGLLHALLVGAAAVALARPPPLRTGKGALLACFVLTGALLALFGQTYQTGADVYELFLAWAGVGLPLALVARCPVVWSAWVLVVDVALALLCGWVPGEHVLWTVLTGVGVTLPVFFALSVIANLALWAASEAAAGTRLAEVAPPWLGRVLVTAAAAFGTWGAVYQIAELGIHDGRDRGGWVLGLALVACSAGVVWWTLRRRRDVFPLAAVALAVVVIGTTVVVSASDWNHGAGVFFVAPVWIVASSGAAAFALMRKLRRWREEGTLA